jgi:hypothetical protein
VSQLVDMGITNDIILGSSAKTKCRVGNHSRVMQPPTVGVVYAPK